MQKCIGQSTVRVHPREMDDEALTDEQIEIDETVTHAIRTLKARFEDDGEDAVKDDASAQRS